MTTVRRRAPRRNHSLELDLFTWAAERDQRHRYTVAARTIARRHNLTELRAALVCEVAGIGGVE
jgi:hypothetical protein